LARKNLLTFSNTVTYVRRSVEVRTQSALLIAVNLPAARVGLLHSRGAVVSLADATISRTSNILPSMVGDCAFSTALCHQRLLVLALLATGAASSEVT
jgi:hypothetical protein